MTSSSLIVSSLFPSPFSLSSGLGVFSELPPEIREQIWLNFRPSDKEEGSRERKSKKTDLTILRASKALYVEVSEAVYRRACLHFDLTVDKSNPINIWETVGYKTRVGPKKTKGNKYGRSHAKWKLGFEDGKRDRRFDNFPFHKIEDVLVSFRVPLARNMNQSLLLWANIVTLIATLKDVKKLPRLLIELQPSTTNTGPGNVWEQYLAAYGKTLIYKFVVGPLFCLKGVRWMHVKTPSNGAYEGLDRRKLRRICDMIINKGPGNDRGRRRQKPSRFGEAKE